MNPTAEALLLSWFITGAKPPQSQFAAWITSYRHKSVPINIDDLETNLKNLILGAGGTSVSVLKFYQTEADRPASGDKENLYVILDTQALFVWNGDTTSYVQVGGGGSIKTSFTTNIAVGGIASGSTIEAGTNLEALFKRLLTTVYVPNLYAPSFTMGHNAGGLRKIGEAFSPVITFNFYQGTIDNSPLGNGSPNQPRAGAATGYTFYKADDTQYAGQPQAGNSLAVAHTVTKGSNVFKGKVAYEAGPQPVDSNGANYDAPFPAGESGIVTTGFEGVYPSFATTQGITVRTELSLFTGGNADVYFTAVSQLGTGSKQSFWIESTDSRNIAFIAKNGLTGAYTIVETADWSVSTTETITIEGNNRTYKKYSYNGGDRGAIDLLVQLRN